MKIRSHTLLLACLLAASCSNIEKADRDNATTRTQRPSIPMDVDPIMRGTVASETVVMGYKPTVVRGYGLVGGLKGTGSKTAPAEVRAYILKELGRAGLGEPNSGFEHLTPEALLNSETTAIVIVEAIIPAGAPKGTEFDVRVYAAPGTSTTSLEGGTLWPTELRPGALLVGSREARAMAKAKGPLIINPFADMAGQSAADVNRLSGRIIGGGECERDMPIRLVLATPSHSRARLITSAINSNYPREPKQRGETAQGMTGEMIEVHVPPSWYGRSDHFVNILRHTSIHVGPIDATAAAIAKAVTNNPGAANAASLRWEALGKKSLTAIRPLYDYPEEQPRFSALQAGAHLDDPTAVKHLLDIATAGSSELRVPAIRLMRRMAINPAIDLGLRPLLNDSDVDVRLAAYEVLRERNDPIIQSQMVGTKYRIDVVPSTHPMVYVAQTGTPAIAIFGDELSLKVPLTLRAWDGDLMFKADAGSTTVEVFYRRVKGAPAIVDKASIKLPELARFLGHSMDPAHPAPGLGMTYSQVIGALHALFADGAYPGLFKVEQDRLVAAIAKAGEEADRDERPDFIEDEQTPPEMLPGSAAAVVPGVTPDGRGSSTGGSTLAPKPPKRDTVPR
jgi:hypothetical protein